jgi:hypothetical protein
VRSDFLLSEKGLSCYSKGVLAFATFYIFKSSVMKLTGAKSPRKGRLDGLLNSATEQWIRSKRPGKEREKMGRQKILNGRLVSIGAKVTEEQMKDINDLVAKLGMNSKSDLFRAAITSYLRNPPLKFGDNVRITDASEGNPGVSLDACPGFKELGISLNDALSKWRALDDRSRLDELVPCSDAECPKKKAMKDT